MNKTQLSKPHRIFTFASLGLLVAGALGWLFSRYALEGRPNWGDAALESQYWSLKVHGAGVMLFLIALGSMGPHLAEGWKLKKLRRLGAALVIVLGAMIVSGWLIYYGPSGDSHDWISMTHWILGLLGLALFILHIAFGRTKAKGRAPRRRR